MRLNLRQVLAVPLAFAVAWLIAGWFAGKPPVIFNATAEA
jgi:hypothetical protein